LQFLRTRHNAAGAFPQIPAGLARQAAGLAAGLAATLVTAGCLTGCSIAIPVSSPSAMWRGAAEDSTGSILKPPLRLSHALEPEDVRRAGAALNTALDPQGSGAGVNWDNPQSGAKGAFTPVGQAYPLDGKICRAFLAEIAAKDAQEKLQGAACRDKSAEWALTDVKPWKKG
jgi:surface antigen